MPCKDISSIAFTAQFLSRWLVNYMRACALVATRSKPDRWCAKLLLFQGRLPDTATGNIEHRRRTRTQRALQSAFQRARSVEDPRSRFAGK